MRAVREARGLSLAGVAGSLPAAGSGPGCSGPGNAGGGRGPWRSEANQEYADWLGVDISLLLPPSEGVQAWRFSMAKDQAGAAKAVREVEANLCRVDPAEAIRMVSLRAHRRRGGGGPRSG